MVCLILEQEKHLMAMLEAWEQPIGEADASAATTDTGRLWMLVSTDVSVVWIESSNDVDIVWIESSTDVGVVWMAFTAPLEENSSGVLHLGTFTEWWLSCPWSGLSIGVSLLLLMSSSIIRCKSSSNDEDVLDEDEDEDDSCEMPTDLLESQACEPWFNLGEKGML